jgi:hypothetical protein
MADMGGKRINDMFCFKHHAVPVPEITATNRIIDATTRLTAAIAGVQDSPPNKWKLSNSFAQSYSERLHCFLHRHQVFFLLLHHAPLWSKKMNLSSFGILNLFSLQYQPPMSTPTTSTPNPTLLPLLRTTAKTTTLFPVNAPDHLITILLALCKTILSHATN